MICLLEDSLRNKLGNIVRAKGVLQIGNEKFRYDFADGLYGIIKESDENAETQCVFIGEGIEKDLIMQRLHTDRELEEHLRPEHICDSHCHHHENGHRHEHGHEHEHKHVHEYEHNH